MEIYIDLIYIINCILGCLCFLSLSIITGKIISFKKLLGLSLIWGFHVVTLYANEWFYIVWVIISCGLFEKKGVMKHTILFLFIHETFMNSLSGVYRIGNVLIITEHFDWALPLLIGLLIIFIYLVLWFQLRHDILNSQLVYDVQIRINEKDISLKGFLDTGNQALYQGLPIIFLKNTFEEFDFISEVNGLEIKTYPMKKGQIYFNQQWQPCIFSYANHLSIQEDCLLNFYLL